MGKVEFAILGAGAIGSILGAHLARSGHSVLMLARARRAQQIERDGIAITGLAEFSQPVPTLSDPAQLEAAEVLIVATKTSVTAAALATLRHADVGVGLSIQNGMMKDELLADAFGVDRVLGALANLSGELLAAGQVLFTRNSMLAVGELDGSDSARARRIAAALEASGIRAAASRDILALEWSKFAAWAPMMIVSVSTRALTWKFLLDPGTALVLVRLVREVGALASARQVRLSDQGVLPVATICQASDEDAVAALAAIGRNIRSTAPLHKMSTLQDLEAGRPLEIEETLGHALRMAAGLGLSLPLLGGCYPLVAGIDRVQRL